MLDDKRKIEVMTAYVNGAVIEHKHKRAGLMWNTTPSPRWDWINYDYRIKPIEEKKEMVQLYGFLSPNGILIHCASGVPLGLGSKRVPSEDKLVEVE